MRVRLTVTPPRMPPPDERHLAKRRGGRRPRRRAARRLRAARAAGRRRAHRHPRLRHCAGARPARPRAVALRHRRRPPATRRARASGVYARISADGRTLTALDARGRPVRTLRAGAGLIAATRAASQQPTWVVTGTDAAGLESAVRAFADGESALAGKFALAVSADRAVALPITRR